MHEAIAATQPRHDPWQTSTATIERVTREAPGVNTYDLRIPDHGATKRFSFAPGQFNMIYVPAVGEAAISISGETEEGCCDTRFAPWVRSQVRWSEGASVSRRNSGAVWNSLACGSVDGCGITVGRDSDCRRNRDRAAAECDRLPHEEPRSGWASRCLVWCTHPAGLDLYGRAQGLGRTWHSPPHHG